MNLAGGPVAERDAPSDGWIDSLRERFPCEREIDRVLTRALRTRRGPGFRYVDIRELASAVETLLRQRLGVPMKVLDPRWLGGGASKLQLAFRIDPQQGRNESLPDRLVLRMEPAASVVETSRLREFEILRAMHGRVPVPRAVCVDNEGEFLPYPGIVYEFVPGVTAPTEGARRVTGLGTAFPPPLRAALGEQFIGHLATIHAFPWEQAQLASFDVPRPSRKAPEWQLNWWERVWEQDLNEDVPLVRLGFAWLRDNMPEPQRITVVHGDYRSGNFLFDEATAKITGWLDWELAHLGDPHEDLAWVWNDAFATLSDDGRSRLLCGLFEENAFRDAYERLSGYKLHSDALRFYRIFNALKCVVLCLATGCRIAASGKTHQDILLAWLGGIGYPIMEELRTLLTEVV